MLSGKLVAEQLHEFREEYLHTPAVNDYMMCCYYKEAAVFRGLCAGNAHKRTILKIERICEYIGAYPAYCGFLVAFRAYIHKVSGKSALDYRLSAYAHVLVYYSSAKYLMPLCKGIHDLLQSLFGGQNIELPYACEPVSP